MSRKGYGLSARTAERFPSTNKNVSPSPQQYHSDQTLSRTISPGKAPFGSKSQRFKTTAHEDDGPGPGSYNAFDLEASRKVSWPMCFGRPDWPRLPQPDKRSLRVKLDSEKEFLKHRSRVAYLSLYY
uniref:Si:ch211-66i15.4 n=1 Tax=Neogobius melanostomus TaxID=47308 RepID=A0A8C6UAI3_9GOBI